MEDHPLPAARDCLFNIFSGLDWQGVLHEWGRGRIHTGYWWKIQKERITRKTKK
jgi:hypothetical protein